MLNRLDNTIEWKFIIIHVKKSYFNETTDQNGFSLVKIRLFFYSFHLHLMTFLVLRQYKRSRKIDWSLNINEMNECVKNVFSNAISGFHCPLLRIRRFPLKRLNAIYYLYFVPWEWFITVSTLEWFLSGMISHMISECIFPEI